MKTTIENAMTAALCFVVYLLIQFVVMLCTTFIADSTALDATPLVVATCTSSAITIALFLWLKWAVAKRNYLNSRPWGAMFFVVTAALGTIPLTSYLLELLDVRLSPEHVQTMVSLLSHDFGYITIGILVPVAEEFVFRGAILRALLRATPGRSCWLAIVISALLFGIAHGNLAQGINATLIGLLLGWLYCRTDSVVPGILFHWTNNTAVYVMTKLMPGSYDMTVSEMCGGDTKKLALYLLCSLCVLLPSIYQLKFRLKKAK